MSRSSKVPQRPAFYARISLDRSGELIGVKDQIEQGKKHFAEIGWPEPVIYSDNDISAKSGKVRPGFEQMLRDIEAGGIDGLGARHLDRVLRRVKDLERVLDVIESQRRPIPVTLIEGSEIDLSSASGRLLARILASVAANESEMKSERVGAARRREAQAGRAHGPLGYGYDADQMIVPEEAAVIRQVAAWVLEGRSLRSIAVDLADRGVPTPGEGRWDSRRVKKVIERGERAEVVAVIEAARSSEAVTAVGFGRALNAAGADEKWTAKRVRESNWAEALQSEDHGLDDSTIAEVLRDAAIPADATRWRAANLRAMIRRGALCGWREFSPGGRGGSGELVAEGTWAPILTKETVEQIRRITDRPGVRGRTPKHLLAGILKCGVCGSSMGGSPDGRGGSRYTCSKQPGLRDRCGGLTVAAEPVDRMVSMLVIDTLADAKIRAGKARKLAPTSAVADAERELATVVAMREEYAAEAAAGHLTSAEWRILREGLTERQRQAERVLGAWAPSTRLVLRDVPKMRPEIEVWWNGETLARRRDVIQVLIESIPVSRSTSGGNRFDPSRLGEPVWKV